MSSVGVTWPSGTYGQSQTVISTLAPLYRDSKREQHNDLDTIKVIYIHIHIYIYFFLKNINIHVYGDSMNAFFLIFQFFFKRISFVFWVSLGVNA